MTRSLILWCRACDRPTMQQKCATCGAATVNPLPPKYSPQDPYGKYRRELKRRARQEAPPHA